jgi:hypothetical protein
MEKLYTFCKECAIERRELAETIDPAGRNAPGLNDTCFEELYPGAQGVAELVPARVINEGASL